MGVITLIPKKDKDLINLKAWRPLTLLNLDYKILSKIMAERVKPILVYLIGEEQTGFLKGHHISDNIRRTFEIIEYCQKPINQPLSSPLISRNALTRLNTQRYANQWNTLILDLNL